jgi:hypothetical protein
MKLFDKIFGRKKKTEQEADKVGTMNPGGIWFTTPTISNEFPQTIPKARGTEFDIFIHEDDYRQNEFLNPSSLPNIEEEFNGIKEIWTNHSKKSEEYTLFKDCHVRNIIGSPGLTVNFNALKSLLKCNSVGQVVINGEILVNGVAFKTDNTTYFGILTGDTIVELGIAKWNDNTTDEILEIGKTFNLLFVNWYHCQIIKND